MAIIVGVCFIASIAIGIAGHIKKRRDLSILSIGVSLPGWWGLALFFLR